MLLSKRFVLATTVLVFASPVNAKKRSVSSEEVERAGRVNANAGDIPALERLLERTGWQPTPELTGAFQAGHVFVATSMGHQLAVDDCFEAQPRENTYTATEIVTNLQAGVSVKFGAGDAGASSGLVRKIKFGLPTHVAIPVLDLAPTQACVAALREAGEDGRLDLDQTYVVKEVLRAEISEQTCGHIDASGSFVTLGQAGAELSMACAQHSHEPVAVAYRTTAITGLLGLAEPEAVAEVPPEAPVVAQPGVADSAPPVQASVEPGSMAPEAAPEQTSPEPKSVVSEPEPAKSAEAVVVEPAAGTPEQGPDLDSVASTPPTAAAEPAVTRPAELLFMRRSVLKRWVEGGDEVETVASPEADALYMYTKAFDIGGLRSPGGSSVYAWGERGLGWYNLSTGRVELLSERYEDVDNAVAVTDDLIVFTQRHSGKTRLMLWSVEEGTSSVLVDDVPSHAKFVGSSASQALVHEVEGGLVVLGADQLRAIARGGEARDGRVLLEPRELSWCYDVAFDDAGVLHVVQLDTDDHGFSYEPIRWQRFDVRSGSPVGDTVEVEDSWHEKAIGLSSHNDLGLILEVSRTLHPSFPLRFQLRDQKPHQLPPGPIQPRWTARPDGFEVEARRLQGRLQLFGRKGDETWQITDIQPPEQSSIRIVSKSGEPEPTCMDEQGLAWRPWPDGRHLVVFAIDERCEDLSPEAVDIPYVTDGRAFLVDALEGPSSQELLDVELGTVLADPGVDGPWLPVDRPVEVGVDWNMLGRWSPNGAYLLTPKGRLVSRDGEILSVDAWNRWAVWVE
jgi:hypothetical protein